MPFIGRKKTRFKNSISENALRSSRVLLTHRVVHLALSVSFLFYAAYLFTHGLIVISLLLAIAAIFDAVQVVTLSKNTNHTPMYFRDIHQVTAWAMAISYLLFSLAFALAQQADAYLMTVYVICLVCVLIGIRYARKAYFWFVQMTFFISVSTMMAWLAVMYN